MSSASLHWFFFMSKYFSVETDHKNPSAGWDKARVGDVSRGRAGCLRTRECVTQQVDDPFVVRSKQPDGVFEEQHEGRVDHPVGQLVRVGLRKTKSSGVSITFPQRGVSNAM